MSETLQDNTRVVTIGGGTGSFTLLQEFKNHFDTTAVVNMADNGGSTGVLRDEFGVLPPGDIRQCLVALSDSSQTTRELMSYRFEQGNGLQGHSLGNLILTAAEKMSDGDYDKAIHMVTDLLNIRGKVLPVTKDKIDLELIWPSGETVAGEFNVGNLHFEGRSRPDIRLTPKPTLNPQAEAAILEADTVVIAPGNLYGSIAPALVVPGMREALSQTDASILYVCNLVTKPGQTEGMRAHEYANEIQRFIGAPVLDYVLYNTGRPEPELLSKYVRDGEFLVQACKRAFKKARYEAVGLPLIADDVLVPQAGDAIAAVRSLIRHDASAVAAKVAEISEQRNEYIAS
jgi:uncharacterized cofD-like protein